jgi:hypothetical protein
MSIEEIFPMELMVGTLMLVVLGVLWFFWMFDFLTWRMVSVGECELRVYEVTDKGSGDVEEGNQDVGLSTRYQVCRRVLWFWVLCTERYSVPSVGEYGIRYLEFTSKGEAEQYVAVNELMLKRKREHII